MPSDNEKSFLQRIPDSLALVICGAVLGASAVIAAAGIYYVISKALGSIG